MLLGDSFAHGICMPAGDDVAGRLRRRGLQTANLGMANHGQLLELATLEEYAAELMPSWLIWLYFEGNDLENLTSELRAPTLLRYLREPGFSQQLSERQAAIDTLVAEHNASALERTLRGGAARSRPWRSDVLDTVKLVRWRARLARWLPALRIGSLRSSPPAFGEILARARDRVASWGGRLLFVYLPDYHRFTGVKSFSARRRVLEIVDELCIPWLDLAPAITAHDDPLALYPFRIHGHFAADGYRLVAEEIAGWIGRYEGERAERSEANSP